ncbi:MAG: class II glutamine amidotransferase [Deltaproteobacteria bacterium]|nr:class II glutamine amidotransferase [Deltaproteobacteria bacterium]
MCRMIAVIGNDKIQRAALRAFHRLGLCGKGLSGLSPGHLDGWGIAAYAEEGPAYAVRSAGSVEVEKGSYREAIESVIEWGSPIVVAHFRKASRGAAQKENVHPFIDPPWIFCHNGTIGDLAPLGPGAPSVGDTDSEELFMRWRRAERADGGRVSGVSHFVDWLRTVEQRCSYTSLTSLLADGKQFVAVRRVGRPFDATYNAKDFADYYTLYHWRQGAEHIICSEPMPDIQGDWSPIADGEQVLLHIR